MFVKWIISKSSYCFARDSSFWLKFIKNYGGGSYGKGSACNAGDMSFITGSGRSPGERNGYPLQYSCLENSTDRGAWRASPWGHKESDTTERLTLSLSRLEENFACPARIPISLLGGEVFVVLSSRPSCDLPNSPWKHLISDCLLPCKDVHC